jgi:hypothetical protein
MGKGIGSGNGSVIGVSASPTMPSGRRRGDESRVGTIPMPCYLGAGIEHQMERRDADYCLYGSLSPQNPSIRQATLPLPICRQQAVAHAAE